MVRPLKASPEIIRLAVVLYVRFPLSLRNIEDLLHERGVDISRETFGSGGTVLVRSSQPRCDGNEPRNFVHGRNSNGTWTRCL